MFRHDGQVDLRAGKVHALVLAQDAAVLHRADDVAPARLVDRQLNEAVVDEDGSTRAHVARKAGAGLLHEAARARDRGLGERDLLARLQAHGDAVGKRAGTDARAAQVEHDRSRGVELAAHLLDAVDAREVLVLAAVAKVEAGDVHALGDQVPERKFAVGGRTHRADDFGPFGLLYSHCTSNVLTRLAACVATL